MAKLPSSFKIYDSRKTVLRENISLSFGSVTALRQFNMVRSCSLHKNCGVFVKATSPSTIIVLFL